MMKTLITTLLVFVFANHLHAQLLDQPDSTKVLSFSEVMPEFPGGQEAFKKYIQDNIVYPRKARKNNVQGGVIITFVVRADGSISDITLVKSLNEECDYEALRIVKKMPSWKPGSDKGKPVNVKFVLPITFRLAD